MASGGEVCTSIIVLIVVLVGIILFLKLLKYLAYLGQYRTGKAMKKISRQGLTINQGQPPQGYYQQPPPQYYNAPPRPQGPPPAAPPAYGQAPPQQEAGQLICPYCGANSDPAWTFCPVCSRRLR